VPPAGPLLYSGCFVDSTIRCLSCGEGWKLSRGHLFSVHGQQAQESCPCPSCGAYTLCCAEAEEEPAKEPVPAG
jgi:hypothetical protein